MRIRAARLMFMAAVVSAVPACMMPGVPAAPVAVPPTLDGVPLAPALAAAPQPPAPPGPLEKFGDTLHKCRKKLCNSPFGQMINGMTMPLSAMTGGVIPTFCPPIDLSDLAKPGVEGESAAVKKDAAEAKARRAAVRVLGTVDCRYYPDVEPKLLAALRTDGNECVRYEAALALSNGCCCSKKIIEILTISVAGGEEDGAPAERSERVRDTAATALARCISCVKVVEEPDTKTDPKLDPDAEIEGPGKLPAPKKDDDKPKLLPTQADRKTVTKARDALAMRQAKKDAAALIPVAPTQVHSVYEMFKYANDGPVAPAMAEPAKAPAAPVTVKPVGPSTLSVARPVDLSGRQAPAIVATKPAQAPAIQATVMPAPAPVNPVVPVQAPVELPEPVITPVQAPAELMAPTITPVQAPAEPMAPAEPLVLPATPVEQPTPEVAPLAAPAIPEAPAVPAIPQVPAVETPAEPAIQVPEIPTVQVPMPPTVIIRPPAAPLPTSPFPD